MFREDQVSRPEDAIAVSASLEQVACHQDALLPSLIGQVPYAYAHARAAHRPAFALHVTKRIHHLWNGILGLACSWTARDGVRWVAGAGRGKEVKRGERRREAISC